MHSQRASTLVCLIGRFQRLFKAITAKNHEQGTHFDDDSQLLGFLLLMSRSN